MQTGPLETSTPASTPLLLDICERIFIGCLYAALAERFWTSFLIRHDWKDLMALTSETLVVLMMLLRRPAREMSRRWSDWLLAFGATCLPLLIEPNDPAHYTATMAGAWLMGLGFALQIWCKYHIFRNFGVAPALRHVVSTGPYRFVRHPIYASYAVFQIGLILTFPSFWNAAVLGANALLQIARIFAEERLLSTDPLYRAYQARVRWRLAPGIF